MAREIVAAIFAFCALWGQPSGSLNPKDLFERGQRSLAAGKNDDAD